MYETIQQLLETPSLDNGGLSPELIGVIEQNSNSVKEVLSAKEKEILILKHKRLQNNFSAVIETLNKYIRQLREHSSQEVILSKGSLDFIENQISRFEDRFTALQSTLKEIIKNCSFDEFINISKELYFYEKNQFGFYIVWDLQLLLGETALKIPGTKDLILSKLKTLYGDIDYKELKLFQ